MALLLFSSPTGMGGTLWNVRPLVLNLLLLLGQPAKQHLRWDGCSLTVVVDGLDRFCHWNFTRFFAAVCIDVCQYHCFNGFNGGTTTHFTLLMDAGKIVHQLIELHLSTIYGLLLLCCRDYFAGPQSKNTTWKYVTPCRHSIQCTEVGIVDWIEKWVDSINDERDLCFFLFALWLLFLPRLENEGWLHKYP